MDETPQTERCTRRWLIGLGALVVATVVLSWFDNSTELRPSHDEVFTACVVVAGLAGLVSAWLAVRVSRRLAVWRRVGLALGFAVAGSILVGLFSTSGALVIEGFVDFPAGTTATDTVLIRISRAYTMGGERWRTGRESWYVQPMPIWSNLKITQRDYAFMLAHRPPGDNLNNADEILSKGYFCARVVVQQSGQAIRIMHAGKHTLPEGTMIICPPAGTATILGQ